MNLPEGLVQLIKGKKVYFFLQSFENNLLVSLHRNVINLATKWRFLTHFEINEETLPILASRGYTETVKWLYINHYIKPHTFSTVYLDWSDYPLDMAASDGNIELVQWLHSQGANCTTFAMDAAAMNEHFNMVKWLHANRKEGCTSAAMDFAAANNDLEMLEWLHQYTKKGFSNSVCRDITDMRPNIYKFILKNYQHLFHPNIIVQAAYYGDLETLQYLFCNLHINWNTFIDRRPNGISYYYTTMAYIEAGKRGNFEVAKWFIEKHLIY